MNEKDVKFTMHALQRARQRKLWKYVSKAKFFYDAIHTPTNQARLDDCIYTYRWVGNKVYIITMYLANEIHRTRKLPR